MNSLPIELVNHILSYRPRNPVAVLINNHFNRCVETTASRSIAESLYTNREWCDECGEDSGIGLTCMSCGVERPHFKSMVKYTIKYITQDGGNITLIPTTQLDLYADGTDDDLFNSLMEMGFE